MNAWIGIDLDGTLAVYDQWQGIEHIGEPIAAMVEYVKSLRAEGIEVKIFTARCQEGKRAISEVYQWCHKHLGEYLEVTDKKDFNMVFCVDDRAVVVEKNTGKFLTNPPTIESIKWHNDMSNPENPEYDSTV